jgi:hypothetical protein
MSVKDKVQEQLQDKGSLSSADLGGFQPREAGLEEEEAKENGGSLDTTDIADVPEDAKNDVVMKVGSSIDTSDAVMQALQNDPAGVLFERGKVELTPADKTAFLEALVSDDRFELPFSLFDGKLTGVFRSRLNCETRAILNEMRRQLSAGDIPTEIEYTTRFRHALLRFHLKELNGEEYKIPEVLGAVVTSEDGEKKVTPPPWVEEAHTFFKGHEAKTAALYNALCVFEGKYWTLVENANNQDFWQTEDSTSE